MLKKLLKYDFKSVFKYWWIAALSSTILSVLGGFCIPVLRDSSSESIEIQPPGVLVATSTLILILCIIGLVAFSITSMILVFVRFYKNFFSDEAYLTFTLPVKRSQLLNSKLILAIVSEFATLFLIGLNTLILLTIGFWDKIFTKAFFDNLATMIKELLDAVNVYTIIYLVEILLFILLASIFSNLFTYACITFASMITKKAKVITAIGIYYAANGIISFVVNILYLFGISNITDFITDLPKAMIEPVVALMGLTVIFFVAVFCALLYTFEHWMLDRKLNLA